jgi:hypothetical protein
MMGYGELTWLNE